VGSDGIHAMNYGFTSMDPESSARSLSMQMVSGKWVQTVEASGTDVPLAEPAASSGERRRRSLFRTSHQSRQMSRRASGF